MLNACLSLICSGRGRGQTCQRKKHLPICPCLVCLRQSSTIGHNGTLYVDGMPVPPVMCSTYTTKVLIVWVCVCCSIVKHKWTLLQRVLELGFNVLVMDVDFVVLRNPFKYFQSLQPVCDLAFYDNMPAFAGQESGDATGVHDLNHVEINTGLLMLQSSQASRLLVSGFLAFLASPAADTSMDDQALFNSFMTRRASNNTTDGMLPSSGNKALRCVEWKGVSVRLLSSVYFGCWEIYFKKNLSDITQETPYAIHYNLLSGAAAKSAMIKRHGFWNSEH